MRKHERMIRQMAADVARPFGLKVLVEVAGSNHFRVTFLNPETGISRFTIVSSTPGRQSAIHWDERRMRSTVAGFLYDAATMVEHRRDACVPILSGTRVGLKDGRRVIYPVNGGVR
jgi:hypothetical protein